MSQRLAASKALNDLRHLVLMGGEGEADPENDPASKGDDEGASKEDGDKPAEGTPISKEEFDKLFARMQAADRRASEAEKKAKQYEDKDKSELEKASGRLAELEAENKAVKAELLRVKKENAFFASNSVTWHDPDLAVKQLDWEGVVKDDGEVDAPALRRAIEALSKSKPFLVKTDDGKGKLPAGNGSTGAPAGSGKQTEKTNTDRDKLLRKYPALRR
jgi:hypothetical protein